jgi:hypothetical protein
VGGVVLFRQTGGPFIGGRSEGGRRPEVAGAGGVRAMGIGDARRCGFGCVLAGLGRSDGALWVGCGELTLVGVVQREERQRGGGSGCFSSLSSLSHGLGRGWGGWARQRECPRHGYRVRAKVNSDVHSKTDFSRFVPTTCSTQCPQELKI